MLVTTSAAFLVSPAAATAFPALVPPTVFRVGLATSSAELPALTARVLIQTVSSAIVQRAGNVKRASLSQITLALLALSYRQAVKFAKDQRASSACGSFTFLQGPVSVVRIHVSLALAQLFVLAVQSATSLMWRTSVNLVLAPPALHSRLVSNVQSVNI